MYIVYYIGVCILYRCMLRWTGILYRSMYICVCIGVDILYVYVEMDMYRRMYMCRHVKCMYRCMYLV